MLYYVIHYLTLNEVLHIKYSSNRPEDGTKCGQKSVVRSESNFGKLYIINLPQKETL
jgi:hypothetical protein